MLDTTENSIILKTTSKQVRQDFELDPEDANQNTVNQNLNPPEYSQEQT